VTVPGGGAARRRLRALVFDMDGTLIDSSTVIPDAYIKVVADLGGPSLTRSQVIDAYSVGPTEAMLTHLLGRPSTSDEVDLYHEVLGAGAEGATVYPGIPEALALLRGRASLAVFTGASLRACRTLLQGVGLDRNFDALVGSDEVERSKPEPDGIHLACRRLGVEPGAAAYVGDAPNDLEAARRSGALAVAAGWGHLYRPEEPADVVVRTPGDLPSLVSA
jgi:HAD superfamily hydrolase (TIGR01509 family)